MNDRAPNGRAAARLVRGVGMGDEMPTYAQHAAVNIGEAGIKAVDAALQLAMNITDESAALDKEKIKGLATAIGWNSSPCNALSYAVAKYVALFSSKGYDIGENFAQWLEAQMRCGEQLENDLRGFVSDLQAICGSRNYVFFLNAAVVECFAQLDQLHGFLIEEKDLATSVSGKLRGAILACFNSQAIMAAVRTMAFICDAWMWPTLVAVKVDDSTHTMDVLPAIWTKSLCWLRSAADEPAAVIDGSMRLDALLGAAGQHTMKRDSEDTRRAAAVRPWTWTASPRPSRPTRPSSSSCARC